MYLGEPAEVKVLFQEIPYKETEVQKKKTVKKKGKK